MDTKRITRTMAIAKVRAQMKYHREHMDHANSFSRNNLGARHAWYGHNTRFNSLKCTLERLEEGHPCTRAIAQLFGKNTRIV